MKKTISIVTLLALIIFGWWYISRSKETPQDLLRDEWTPEAIQERDNVEMPEPQEQDEVDKDGKG